MANFSGLAIVAGTLRTIVIDGCNVGFHHGKHKFLSLRGVNICAEYFTKRGHEVGNEIAREKIRRKLSSSITSNC